MSAAPVKTRFAPSPTGFLHIGNLRTALFSALFARARGGHFLLRIEDTDAERSRPEFTEALLDDLRWAGLDWDEGFDGAGAAGPYAQSARTELYETHFATLAERGLVYPCFCSDTTLALERKRQLAAGRPPRYAGTCARLGADEVARRIAAGEPHALRFRVPAGEAVEFEDIVRGPQRFATDDIGDFILRRSGGAVAFFFGNAVDDALMGVTHVLRGEDHLTNTPRQMLLQRALGLPEPRYGHLALIVGDDGAPLSKRHGAASVRDLRAAGYLPGAVLNYLARLGHHYDEDRYMDAAALAGGFHAERLGKAPARFDRAQLDHWQREAVHAAGPEALADWLGQRLDPVPAAARAAFLAVVGPNLLFPPDVERWVEACFGAGAARTAEAEAALAGAVPGYFAAALAAWDEHGADFAAFVAALKAASGARGKALFQPLRAALTGALDGPELAPLAALMGRERVRERLARARDRV